MWPLHLETKCRFFVCNESPVDWSYHGVPRLKKVSKAKIKYKKKFCFGVHRKIDKTVIIHINSTAIKVSIPHKEMSLCCFLSISGSKNVIWASFDVVVSRGVLLGILGEGVPPGSPNPDLVPDQKCHFSHPFSDLVSKIHTRFRAKKLRHHYFD